MADSSTPHGTYKFDGAMATLGYNLNRMCFTFNEAAGREAFLQDEAAYCDKFGLNEVQKEAILKRDIITLLRNGGSIYYLAKFAGVLGLNVQDLGGIMTGQTTAEFQAYLDSQKVGKPNG
ncbi:MAG TPA: protocatechuate 3,4-dioxygenase [Marinobacterium sp.]|nr:protocatechuate 3,4-dioxygenase [Marinobacterium sp.]